MVTNKILLLLCKCIHTFRKSIPTNNLENDTIMCASTYWMKLVTPFLSGEYFFLDRIHGNRSHDAFSFFFFSFIVYLFSDCGEPYVQRHTLFPIGRDPQNYLQCQFNPYTTSGGKCSSSFHLSATISRMNNWFLNFIGNGGQSKLVLFYNQPFCIIIRKIW